MIPDFLKIENRTKPTEFSLLVRKYREEFHDSPPTEPSFWSEEEWVEILKKCLKKHKTVREITGITFDEDGVDY